MSSMLGMESPGNGTARRKINARLEIANRRSKALTGGDLTLIMRVGSQSGDLTILGISLSLSTIV